MYRQKLDPHNPISEVFQTQLSQFYEQVASVSYEDMSSSVHFYTAATLLVEVHALYSFNVDVVRKGKQMLLEKFQVVSDFSLSFEFWTRFWMLEFF